MQKKAAEKCLTQQSLLSNQLSRAGRLQYKPICAEKENVKKYLVVSDFSTFSRASKSSLVRPYILIARYQGCCCNNNGNREGLANRNAGLVAL